MFQQFDGPDTTDASSRTIASRDEARQLIVDHTNEFLKRGGVINVIEGYVAPTTAKLGYGRSAIMRGNRASNAQKHFK